MVAETDAFRLLLFGEDDGITTPWFILPPLAGHLSMIADYQPPNQSLVWMLLHNGAKAVYVIDYKSATFSRRNESIDDLISYTRACADWIGRPFHLVGLCQGGWQASIFAVLFADFVKSLTIAGSPIDAKADGGKLQEYLGMLGYDFYDWMVKLNGGLWDGKFSLFGFKMMNAYDRFIGDWINLWLCIHDHEEVKRKRHFREWYEATLKMGGRWFLQAIQWIFIENQLYEGTMVVHGQVIDLSKITCPVVLIAGTKDDITLINQVMNMAKKISSKKVLKLIVDAGHIGLFMGTKIIRDEWKKVVNFILDENPA